MNFFEKVHHALNKITDPILNNTHYIKFGVKMTWVVIKIIFWIVFWIWIMTFLSNNS
jgi:hypothetical protein